MRVLSRRLLIWLFRYLGLFVLFDYAPSGSRSVCSGISKYYLEFTSYDTCGAFNATLNWTSHSSGSLFRWWQDKHGCECRFSKINKCPHGFHLAFFTTPTIIDVDSLRGTPPSFRNLNYKHKIKVMFFCIIVGIIEDNQNYLFVEKDMLNQRIHAWSYQITPSFP
jgi:hypothetical protein